MKNKKILIIYIINLVFCNYQNSAVEYLIYTSPDFLNHANLISELYEEDISSEYYLNTDIILTSEVESINLSSYLFDLSNNYITGVCIGGDNINASCTQQEECYGVGGICEPQYFDNLKYLLIIGDETIIEPIYYNGVYPTDDYFSSKNQNTNNIPIPKLATGRILINDSSSYTQITNIIDYSL